jgi:endonuclease/exonuclease/phosphatase family metal-dependent hydrolase
MTTLRPKGRRVIFLVVFAFFVTALTAAAPAPTAVTSITNIGGASAEVRVDGRTLRAYDNHADNHSAVGLYRANSTGPWAQVWVTGGAGTSSPAVTLPAATSIQISACIGEAGYPNQVIWDSCRGKTTTVTTTSAAGTTTPPPLPPAQPPATGLNVMDWNVQGPDALDADIAGWAQTIRQHNPAIVALQEFCRAHEDDLTAALGGSYELFYSRASGNPACGIDVAFGNAILVRTDHLVQSWGDLRYLRQGGEDFRSVQWVGILLPGDTEQTFFYNTHLDCCSPEIVRFQIEQLMTVVGVQNRTVLMGDLNTNPTNTERMNLIFGNGFRDVDRDCYRFTNDGCTFTKQHKIDWILMRLMREQTREIVQDNEFSDHNVLVSSLVTYNGWNAGSPAINFGGTPTSATSTVTFNPTTHMLTVDDTIENGLSAVGVFWVKRNNVWVEAEGTRKFQVWNPNGADGGTLAEQVPVAAGEQVIYAACDGHFRTADPPQLFWDSCGNQQMATAR